MENSYDDGLHESDYDATYDGLTPNETEYAKKHIENLNDEITRDIIDGENSYYDRVYRVNNEPVNSRSLTEHRDPRDRRQVKGLKNDITTKSNLTRIDTKLDVLIQMVQTNSCMKPNEIETDNTDFNVMKAYLKKIEPSLRIKQRFFKQNSDTQNYKELKQILKLIE